MVCSMVNSLIMGQRYMSVYDSVVGQVREGGTVWLVRCQMWSHLAGVGKPGEQVRVVGAINGYSSRGRLARPPRVHVQRGTGGVESDAGGERLIRGVNAEGEVGRANGCAEVLSVVRERVGAGEHLRFPARSFKCSDGHDERHVLDLNGQAEGIAAAVFDGGVAMGEDLGLCGGFEVGVAEACGKPGVR